MHLNGVTDDFPGHHVQPTSDIVEDGGSIKVSNLPSSHRSLEDDTSPTKQMDDPDCPDFKSSDENGEDLPNQGLVTSPVFRRILAEEGADQPLPHFSRKDANELDAVLAGVDEAASAESLDSIAREHGVSAHRLRMRALTRELAHLEGELDSER